MNDRAIIRLVPAPRASARSIARESARIVRSRATCRCSRAPRDSRPRPRRDGRASRPEDVLLSSGS